ncbi:MAG: lipoyl synthase [Actinomycetota bacterium]|nr:lipoyl synthase [Actinomycetota bacterium]
MLRIRRLGQVSYAEAFDLQHALAQRGGDDYLLLVEHPHVYTLGVRADPAHVLRDPASVGATLFRTDRGGDVTYHGPGQLVAYPIVTLEDHPGAGPLHVHRIEQLVIDALGLLGVEASRHEGYPGVWVGVDGPSPRKVAAIGVRTMRVDGGRRRTLHGVALNVDCDLEMFGHIVPCGIADYAVTSLRAEGNDASMDEVVEAVASRAAAVWGTDGVDRRDVDLPRRKRHPGGNADVAEERPLLRRLRDAGTDPDAGIPFRARKPEWLRAPARMGEGYVSLGRTIHDLRLVTVCEEAGCPNIFECWADGTATFMVNGSRCTRACGFCLVDTRRPLPLDPTEPDRVAEAVARMRLSHAVITCVARDDLDDGGAGAIAATVRAVRRRNPETGIEVLVSDFKGDASSLELVLDARPDVLNHNVETVVRLQRAVRPSAGYARSLAVLARAADAGLVVKSGLMVGLGESEEEVVSTLADMASVGVSIATIGQYLRPSADHLPVARWWSPAELEALATAGRELGLLHVEASPLTRSSYHAKQAADAASSPADASEDGGTAHAATGSAPLRVVLRPGVPVPVPKRVGGAARVG